MIEIAEVLRTIGAMPSYNDKQALLRKYADLQGFKEVLRFIYNPYFRTGISDNKVNKALSMVPTENVMNYKEIMSHLRRHNTGADTDICAVAYFLTLASRDYLDMAISLVTQKLSIGVDAKTLNAVFGAGFIPIVGCMLGTEISKVPAQNIAWPCVVTEKLDGVRRILIKEHNICRMFSRSGHEDTGLVDILDEARFLPNNRVYDGELLATGIHTNSIALRQATASLANGKGIRRGLTFNIFDMLHVDDFYAGRSPEVAQVRKAMLGATLGDEGIQMLPCCEDNWPKLMAGYGIPRLQWIKPVSILGFAKNMSEVEPILDRIRRRHGEGVMLNTANNLYEIKRTKTLLKVKFSEELVLPVVDMYEGTGKYEDMLGALVVEYKGNRVGVGTGFTDAAREIIWKDRSKYLGRYVEIETFGESVNQSGGTSLNCPRFKRFAGEE